MLSNEKRIVGQRQILQKSLHRESFHLDRYGNSKLGRISGAVMSEKGGKQGSVEFLAFWR